MDSIVSQLKNIGALKIVLFGSLASDEMDVDSDLDIFVLMPSTRTGKEWMDIIYEKIERKIDAEIIVYTHEEFLEELPASIFLKNILNERVIYEKTV